ncbi:MAG: glycosyltransferase [Anaerolineales bacterium]|nr:glycosyltransferase [Anaerolineales bacterium]NUQ83836.1 glycosyltransferase [Anaerolineales bacterium]
MPAPTEKKNPLVSVVIPNYNHARFLGDAIRSVLNQDYRNFEVIVVDDGSTDNSGEVAAVFGDSIRYIYQTNAGLSAARNTGIRAAKGSLIGVLDADDMYEPMFLDTLVNALESDPDADGVYCGYQFVDETNNLLPQIENRPVTSDRLYEALLDGNFLVPESMFLRRYVYDEAGLFDESLRACEDWDVWLRAAKKYRIIHAPRILTRHRILAGSMSTDPLRMLTNRLAVLKKHVGGEPLVEGSSILHRAYGRAYLGSCVEYLQYGDPDRAYQCFQKMANICPELLTEVDTFYQLGCGDQPKGRMGDLASLNVKRNSIPLLVMMKSLFVDAGTGNAVKRLERASYAKAFYSLGLLAYGTREFGEARRFFLRAVLNDLKLAFNRQIVSLWVKSLLSPKMVDWLKSFRQRSVST